MKRITITKDHKTWAEKYLKEMKYARPRHGYISNACWLLSKLSRAIESGWFVPLPVKNNNGSTIYTARPASDFVSYLGKIIVEYEQLLVMPPRDFQAKISDFDSIINTKEVCLIKLEQKKDIEGKNTIPAKKVLFHELIVQYMRYNHVQSKIFSKYVRKIGIKTCVYCNAQYAITTKGGVTLYQLDHCLPKSRYPYLSTCFFNLQPSCGTCNLYKSDNDMKYGVYSPTIWRDENDHTPDYFYFKIGDKAMADYITDHDAEKIGIEFKANDERSADIGSLLNDYQKYFHIDDQYAEHKDVAEEIIWKKYAYSSDYMKNLANAFKPIAPNMVSDLSRLIMGHYMEEEKIFKRPLSKMVQDIAKQLHIDFDVDDKN